MRRPDPMPPRGLKKEDAAAYCGCETVSAFDDWVKKGIVSGPIPGTQRWDRKAIDIWLDRASGIQGEATASDPLGEWLASKAARSRES